MGSWKRLLRGTIQRPLKKCQMCVSGKVFGPTALKVVVDKRRNQSNFRSSHLPPPPSAKDLLSPPLLPDFLSRSPIICLPAVCHSPWAADKYSSTSPHAAIGAFRPSSHVITSLESRGKWHESVILLAAPSQLIICPDDIDTVLQPHSRGGVSL